MVSGRSLDSDMFAVSWRAPPCFGDTDCDASLAGAAVILYRYLYNYKINRNKIEKEPRNQRDGVKVAAQAATLNDSQKEKKKKKAGSRQSLWRKCSPPPWVFSVAGQRLYPFCRPAVSPLLLRKPDTTFLSKCRGVMLRRRNPTSWDESRKGR